MWKSRTELELAARDSREFEGHSLGCSGELGVQLLLQRCGELPWEQCISTAHQELNDGTQRLHVCVDLSVGVLHQTVDEAGAELVGV
jgi:hypothetical protein